MRPSWRRNRAGLWEPVHEIAGGALRVREPYQIKLLGLGVAGANGQAVASIPFPAAAIGRVGVISRLIASIGSIEGQSLVRDTFSRTIAAGFHWSGPIDLGDNWVNLSGVGGADNIWSVNGSQGVAAITQNIGSIRSQRVPNVGVADQNILLTLVSNTAATGEFGIIGRVQDASNYYYLRTTFSAANTASGIDIIKRVGGADTTLGSVVKSVALPAFLRFILTAAVLQGRIWNTSAIEPTTPDVEVSDLSLKAAGDIGVRALNAAAATNTVTADNLQVTGTGGVPSWDAYLGDAGTPANLRDSTAGTVLSRWIPSLVNGQPFFPGDVLNIVAYGLVPGTQITVTTFVSLSPG